MKKKYPFSDMKIGDAFDVNFSDVNYPSLRAYVHSRGVALGMHFSIRAIVEERVWEVSRVEPQSALSIKPARPRGGVV